MTSSPAPAAKSPRRRRIWIVLAVFGALVVAIAIALPFFLDVERHRGRVEAALRDATGWEPELGEMKLSVLRGLSLGVRPASLTSPDGASRVQIASIGIKAAWRPLLSGRLEIRRIDVRSPSIELERRTAEDDWSLPLPVTAGPVDDPSSTSIEIAIGTVAVSDGTIRITDRTVDPPTDVKLEKIAVILNPTLGDIEGSATVGSGRLEWNGPVDGGTEIRLTGLSSEDLSSILGPGLLEPGGRLSGTVHVGSDLAVRGRIDASDLKFVTGEYPLGQAQLDFEVSESEAGMSLDSLEIRAGDAAIHGDGALTPDLRIALTMAETPLTAALALARALFPLPLDLREPGTASLRAWLEEDESGELVYHADGTLDAASLIVADFLPPATGLETNFNLTRDGRLEIDIEGGSLGGGPLTGGLSIDSVDPPGQLHALLKLDQSSLGDLLSGMAPDAKDNLAGLASAELDLTLDLSVEDPGPDALRGSVTMSTGEVTLPGWDLEHRVESKFDDKLGVLSSLLGDKLSRGRDENSDPKDAVKAFDRLNLTIALDELPWKLKPFRARAGDLMIRGRGSFDPNGGAVSMRFDAVFNKRRSAEWIEDYKSLRYLADDQGRITLPIEINGPMTRPDIDIDLGEALLGGGKKEEALKGLLDNLLDRDD